MRNDFKDKLIILALSLAWGAGISVFGFVLAIKYDVILLINKVDYLEKNQENCVNKDVYELDKIILKRK